MNFFDKKKGSSKVIATVPSAPVLYRFRALVSFWSDAFNSQYTVGAIYSVRQGNEKLAKAVTNWITQNKVEVL